MLDITRGGFDRDLGLALRIIPVLGITGSNLSKANCSVDVTFIFY